MNKKTLESKVSSIYDAADCTWEVVETKRMDKVHVVIKKESGRLNLLMIYFTLKRMVEQLEIQLGIAEPDDKDH